MVIMSVIQFVRLRGLLLAAFAAVYVLWGSTHLAIALAVQSIPPSPFLELRTGRFLRERADRGKQLPPVTDRNDPKFFQIVRR
jgi:hypothetical protein